MRRYVSQLSFGLVLAALSVATVIGVGISAVLHRLYLIPIVIGVAVAVGVLYIVVFGISLPEPEPLPSAPPVSSLPPTGEPSGSSASVPVESAPAATAPLEPVRVEAEDLEPFYDPVEEADRLDSEKRSGGPPASGSDNAE